MNDTTLILLAAGSSTRFGLPVKKQWLFQGDSPLWQRSADEFASLADFKDIIIVSSQRDIEYMRLFADYRYVAGGNSRQESLSNALSTVDTPYVLVNDIARCCIDKKMIKRVLSKKGLADCIVPALEAVDTMYEGDRLLDRSIVRSIQTPQLSKTDILKEALKSGEFTDESGAISSIGGSIEFVEGSHIARKLTTIEDIELLPCLKKPSQSRFTGFGIDTHPFESGKRMYLCGVEIVSDVGFKAHSDGDVAIHALIDAILGAAGLGDIGEHFPDSDERYRGADSSLLLQDTVKVIRSVGLDIEQCDMTIVAQKPRLLKYKEQMRKRLADILGIRERFVNIKATTSEKLGFIGRKEGVTVHAVATLKYYDWQEGVRR